MSDISKDLLNKVADCKSVDDIVNTLNANGVSVTKEVLEKEMFSKEPQELSDDDLNNVTGGVGLVNILTEQLAKFIKGKLEDLVKDNLNK